MKRAHTHIKAILTIYVVFLVFYSCTLSSFSPDCQLANHSPLSSPPLMQQCRAGLSPTHSHSSCLLPLVSILLVSRSHLSLFPVAQMPFVSIPRQPRPLVCNLGAMSLPLGVAEIADNCADDALSCLSPALVFNSGVFLSLRKRLRRRRAQRGRRPPISSLLAPSRRSLSLPGRSVPKPPNVYIFYIYFIL